MTVERTGARLRAAACPCHWSAPPTWTSGAAGTSWSWPWGSTAGSCPFPRPCAGAWSPVRRCATAVLRVTFVPDEEGVAPRWLSRRTTAADRAAAGTVADETARLVEALGVWATSVSSTSGTAAGAAPDGRRPHRRRHRARPEPGAAGPARGHGRRPPGRHRDAGRCRPAQEPQSETPYDAGRCGHCGAGTGVGQALSCQVCPICQGIALLRTVRPETVDRLADLAGAVAATLREVAAHVRTGAHEPAGAADGSGAGRAGRRRQEPGGPGAPRGPATVQDIPVDDGDSSDEGDEW